MLKCRTRITLNFQLNWTLAISVLFFLSHHIYKFKLKFSLGRETNKAHIFNVHAKTQLKMYDKEGFFTFEFSTPEGGLRTIRKTELEENNGILKNPLYTLHKGTKRHNICSSSISDFSFQIWTFGLTIKISLGMILKNTKHLKLSNCTAENSISFIIFKNSIFPVLTYLRKPK